MSWGSLVIGRIPLKETYRVSDQVNASSGERTLTLTGVETNPGLTRAEVHARREDLMGIRGELVGVTFSQKPEFDAFYTVKDLGAVLTDWTTTDAAVGLTWNATLSLIGPANAVDIESRLTGVARTNAFAVTGKRWHAPAAGSQGWYVAGGSSGVVSRVTEDAVTVGVQVDFAAGQDPLWSVATVAGFLSGRVKFLSGGLERYGQRVKVPATGWELNNGLVRIRPAANGTGSLDIAAWDGSWQTKTWNLRVGTDVITPAEILGVTVLRNDTEAITLRMFAVDPSRGRTYVDLLLRRGSRFAEGYVRVASSATLGLRLEAAEASTQTSGYTVATANDADGNKAWVASALSYTTFASTGLDKATTTTLDFAVGVVLNGTGAVSGDAAADLYDQYIGALPEATMGVYR